METLTPELERRLQVEELWARRIVLCELINKDRYDRYQSRRVLLSFNGADGLAEVTVNHNQPAATEMACQPTTEGSQFWRWQPQSGLLQGLLGAAVASVLVVIGLAQFGAPISQVEHFLERMTAAVHSASSTVSPTPPTDKTDARPDSYDRSAVAFPDLHHEVSQRIRERLSRP